MRTTLLKALVILALLVILVGMPLLLTPHRIRPSSFARIHIGMTESAVNDVLGTKPGNYDGYAWSLYLAGGFSGGPAQKQWCSRHGSIRVFFDEDNCVNGRFVGLSEPETWWARLWQRFSPAQDRDLLSKIAWTR